MARFPWAVVLPLLMIVVRRVVFLPGFILAGAMMDVGARSIVDVATVIVFEAAAKGADVCGVGHYAENEEGADRLGGERVNGEAD